jgi:alkylation response protein AidB-like acyl-CoA dehydrogenase
MDESRAKTITPDALRQEVRDWLSSQAQSLARFRGPDKAATEEVVARELELQRMLSEAGFTRLGWPLEAGGLGGSMELRGVVFDELHSAGYRVPETLDTVEICGPALTQFAPHLASEHLLRAIAGEEVWCQGFSEPAAGSDLGALETRAVECEGGYRLRGQKVWASFGQVAQYGVVLARTGEAKSGYRGLSMFFVDLSLPGVTVRPITAANGRNEFAEIFLDDAEIPKECLIGALGDGWTIAMFLLQFERGMYAWTRQSKLHARLEKAMAATRGDGADAAADAVGDAYLTLYALRAKSRETVKRLAAGETPGPEISIDKVLLSMADQAVFEVARRLTAPSFQLGNEVADRAWRAEWFYARAASIFGGAVEIQRDIISERLLGLPKGRAVGN